MIDPPSNLDGAMITEPAPRSSIARIGILSLNVLQPGLGLLRLGYWRPGASMITLPLVWATIWILIFAVAPTPSFLDVVVFAGLALAFVLALYAVALVMTWRRSAWISPSPRWWTRWYALVGVVLLAGVADQIGKEAVHRFYKPFYMPGESMAPALGTYDKIIADMRGGRSPALGDVVLIRSGPTTYVKRVIGLPGQSVSMSNDTPVIDHVSARLRDAGWTSFVTSRGDLRGHVFHELLPGETRSHDIMITGPTDYGNMGEIVVPPGKLFVLGDNRERSVDSRLPPDEQGLGMVAISDIVGRPLYVTWSRDHPKIGLAVDH